MRTAASTLAALAICLLVPFSGLAQAPVRDGQPADAPGMRSEDVFMPIRPVAPPAKQVLGAARINAASMAAAVTNSVINAGGGWDASLSGISTGKPEIDRMILESAARHGVDPKLIYAVMHQESGFRSGAVSHAGACGYMQLMPGTARRFGVTNIFDPKQNIDAGSKYLRFLLDLFDGNIELALAGYNAGEYRVIRSGYRVPQIRETRNYVRAISANYYRRAGRRYNVTFGPSTITEQQREDVGRQAHETTAERPTLASVDANGVVGFSNIN
jgi:soluble lytic murein transglycosylase-like protein